MLLESYCRQSAINCSNNKQGWNKKIIVIEDDAVVNDFTFCSNSHNRGMLLTCLENANFGRKIHFISNNKTIKMCCTQEESIKLLQNIAQTYLATISLINKFIYHRTLHLSTQITVLI